MSSVIQKNARAGGDVVGGNKTEIVISPLPVGIVERLVQQLEAEIEDNKQSTGIISILQTFYLKKAPDGIQGLEAKLLKGNRTHELQTALEKKEMFSKLLEQYALYESAQKIFAHLLSRAEHEFSSVILPNLSKLDESSINDLITSKIVNPTVHDCGTGLLMMTHGTALGMFYWLAEQCFVRWHQ